MNRRRSLLFLAIAILQFAVAPLPTASPGAPAPAIPERLTDREFWNLVTDLSEPNGEFRPANNQNLVFADFYSWTRKLQARFLAGDIVSAVDAASKAEPLLWTSAAMFESAEYRLYAALAHAAAWDGATADERAEHRASVLVHHKQLEVWADHNPVTFVTRAALVGAEIARIDGRVLDAQQLYEDAVRAAHDAGLVHNEGLANELAGRFYAARGFDRIATTYLRDARYCYLRWGASGKVRQLEQLYPQLRADKPATDSTTTIVAWRFNSRISSAVCAVSSSVIPAAGSSSRIRRGSVAMTDAISTH